MKFKPNGRRVLILPDEVRGVTKSGILIPPTDGEVAKSGAVLKIGDIEDPEIAIGDRVMFLGSVNLPIDDKPTVLVAYDDIICVL